MSVRELTRRIRVARGETPGDLLLTGGHVVNVFTGTIDRADVVIADGVIAGVGAYDWTAGETIDIGGGFVAPGLIDAHMHIESTLLVPAELARLVVPRGTTAVISDPHEIGNVLGVAGVEQMLRWSEGLPLDCFVMAPSCVPASPFENAGATLGAPQIAELLAHERVLGLAEMMNFPGVLAADGGVLAKIAATHAARRPVDGHCPGLSGRDLVAYAAAGVRSEHECTTPEEALARAALGMLVQVREGSMARNLDTMLPLIVADRLGDWCLCTDDIHPGDLVANGHIDTLLARVVAAGVPAAKALRHATLVPARHYGIGDRGAVAPGYRADLAVFADLAGFVTRLTIHGGSVVAADGVYRFEDAPPPIEVENTIRVGPLAEDAFTLRVAGAATVPVIGVVPDQIVTTRESRRVAGVDGTWTFDPAEDLALIACIQRHAPTGAHGLGLVTGFGFARHGALASSVGHDAHNLLVTGTNPRDMRAAVDALRECGGGFAVVRDGAVTARMTLPVAGLMSTKPAAEVCAEQAAVDAAAAALGCPLHSPFGTLSFLALTVIPSLRITDEGLFDVDAFALVPGGSGGRGVD